MKTTRFALNDCTPVSKPDHWRWVRHASLICLFALGGCAPMMSMHRQAPDEAPVIQGSAPRGNRTPVDGAFVCLANELRARHRPRLAIAVGDVKDYTGKYSQNDGSAITQGGALMVYSALGKMGNTIQLQERFDTRIAELELAYIDRRQLGDGSSHPLQTPQGTQAVPWVPYFGGTILRSDYYIVGGITELNYNIQSNGGQVLIGGVGPKARTFTMSIGIDLRIIDTKTLVVVDTVSLQKQIVGFEVGFDTFRFWNDNLFDINIGAKNMEPLQLGVRATLEQGVLDLLGAVNDIDPQPCLDQAMQAHGPSTAAAPAAGPQAAAGAPQAEPIASEQAASAAPVPIETVANAAPITTGSTYQVAYEFGDPGISQQSASAIGNIVAAAALKKPVEIQIIARDTENWSPIKRQELTGQRIRNLRDALAMRGIHPARVVTAWEPAMSDTSIRRDGAGYQIFALVKIMP
ncbi:CsgG/HfaB family protein [Castellaniella sp.]|uniref:CsgG/HfaB family protein n=1 Tax=Castellaniella sp. TaxID=1955812 RepID=UPI0035690565